MNKFNAKENIGLIVGLSLGALALIASIATYCGIYFSTPNYLLIKNNEFVGNLETYDSEGNLNKEKYYTLEDSNLIKTENNEEGELNKIYFNVEEFLTLNSSYSEFEINLHFSVSAINSNLEGNLSANGEGISLYSLNKSNESSTASKVLYDTYPTVKTDFTYKFKERDDISEIGVKVDATIINSEQEELSKVKIDSSSFYFSVLGVAKWH